MKVYDSQNLRNLAVIGHGGSGKTTLVNAMAWLAGSCGRMGSVEDGNYIMNIDLLHWFVGPSVGQPTLDHIRFGVGRIGARRIT